jgi:alpha-beta hydrolase superfamily lysophospholipase
MAAPRMAAPLMQQTQGHFSGVAGARIFYQYWKPDTGAKAVILIAHGAAEHSGRYERVARHFVSLGYAVAALDHFGHGRSDGGRCCLRAFSDYTDTLDIFRLKVESDFPGLPLILLGHSMGGLISANYLLQQQEAFVGCILSGPAIKTELEPPLLQLWLIKLFSLLQPDKGVLQLDASGVSRDPVEVERYASDPLNYSGKLTARLVAELFKAMREAQIRAGEIHLPLLLLHGGDDALASPEGSRFLNEHAGAADKTLKIYPGLYHEIFNEPERLEVFADMEAWLCALVKD